MTDENICGAETAGTDGPCQNPAGENGRCWIPSHNADTGAGDAENPQGRDFAIGEDDHEVILEAAREGKSERGCARAAGVSSWAQLNRYLEAHPDFRSSFERARARGETELLEGGLYDDEVDSSMAKFLLASSFDYKKTEKREVEADVDQTTTHELGADEREMALETIRELQERESA